MSRVLSKSSAEFSDYSVQYGSASLNVSKSIRSKIQHVPGIVLTPIQSPPPSGFSKYMFNNHVAVNHSLLDYHLVSGFAQFDIHYSDDQSWFYLVDISSH